MVAVPVDTHEIVALPLEPPPLTVATVGEPLDQEYVPPDGLPVAVTSPDSPSQSVTSSGSTETVGGGGSVALAKEMWKSSYVMIKKTTRAMIKSDGTSDRRDRVLVALIEILPS